MSQVQYQALVRVKASTLPLGGDAFSYLSKSGSAIALGLATTSLPDVHLHIARGKLSIDAFKKQYGVRYVEEGAIITWPQDRRGEWVTADEIRANFDKLKMPA